MRTIWDFHSDSEMLPDPGAFDTQKWFDHELKRFNEVRNRAREINLPIAPSRHYSISSVIPLLNLRSVIDFGGCFGSAFFSIDPDIRENIRYQVLERETLVDFANSKRLDDLPYQISSSTRLTADLLYMNSVIQYLNDDWFKKILSDFSGSYFLIDDLYLNETRSFIVKQNFYDDSIFALIRKTSVFFN